jgi:hypothetical protein
MVGEVVGVVGGPPLEGVVAAPAGYAVRGSWCRSGSRPLLCPALPRPRPPRRRAPTPRRPPPGRPPTFPPALPFLPACQPSSSPSRRERRSTPTMMDETLPETHPQRGNTSAVWDQRGSPAGPLGALRGGDRRTFWGAPAGVLGASEEPGWTKPRGSVRGTRSGAVRVVVVPADPRSRPRGLGKARSRGASRPRARPRRPPCLRRRP